MRPKLPPRVVGIYPDRERFRVVVCENGKRKSLILATQEEAQRVASELTASLSRPRRQVTVAEALAEWTSERVRAATCKPLTIREQDARLHAFLADCLSQDIASLTSEQATQLYQAFILRPAKKSGKPPAAASHRLYLKLSRAFFGWAQEQGLCAANPFAGVKPLGRVQHGKPQLRIDEARRFLAAAFQHHAQTQEPLAVGVAAALLMGLRTSEVLERRVRDIESGAQILCIERGKTANASRRLEVPSVLRPYLLSLTSGRAGDELVFGHTRAGQPRSRQYLHALVRRLCQRASVPPICTHSLRGLFATLGVQSGAVTHSVAASLGHGSFATTELHYAQPGAADSAASQRVSALLSEAPAVEPAAPPASPLLAGLSAEQILAQLDSQTRRRLLVLLTQTALAPSAEASAASSQLSPDPAPPERSSR
jgi:integrase